MESTASSALGSAPIQLLLVGDNDDFRYLHELLSQTGDGHLGLDHARSTEEALLRLSQSTYDLLLCEYKAEEGATRRLLHELRRKHPGAPAIFLSDHMDEIAVEMALKEGGEDFAAAIPGRCARDSRQRPPCHRCLSQGTATRKDGGHSAQTVARGRAISRPGHDHRPRGCD